MQTFQKVHPLEFQKRFLAANVRADARTVHQFRGTEIARGVVGTCCGSALVKLGNTSVVAGVRAELGRAPLDEAACTVVANIELLPICSAKFSVGRPSDLARCINSWLNQLLCGGKSNRSRRRPLVVQEQLLLRHLLPTPHVVESGDAEQGTPQRQQRAAAPLLTGTRADPVVADGDALPLMAWYLYVDLYCTDFAGNCHDCALTALTAALLDVRLPDVRRDGAVYTRTSVTGTLPLPLQLHWRPASATFVVLADFVVADPSLAEEELAAATFSVVLDEHDQVRSLRKPGGAALHLDTLRQCLQVARERSRDVAALLAQ